MALQLDLPTSQIGVPFPQAYARIYSISGDDTRIAVIVAFYSNAQARADMLSPVESKTYYLDNPDYNVDLSVKKILYSWLKTFPEFATSTDV